MMSKRHRDGNSIPRPKAELRAHAHRERHRVKGELHSLATSVGRSLAPDECDEPAVEWKTERRANHHHATERATRGRRLRHWKTKEWKRRTSARRARAHIEEQTAKEA
jgi:hypothetical protein